MGTDMNLTLYHYWRSSCSWRVRWAFELKGISCRYVAVNLLDGEVDSQEHLQRNPMGTVPALEVNGAFLGQSLAIIQWAEETFPAPKHVALNLPDGSPWERAKMHQIAETINADIQPLQNLTPQQLHSPNPEEQKKWAAHWIRDGLTAVEKVLEETSGQWCIGDQLSLADLCLIPQVFSAVRYEVSLEKLPICRRIYDAARATPACTASSPEVHQPKSR